MKIKYFNFCPLEEKKNYKYVLIDTFFTNRDIYGTPFRLILKIQILVNAFAILVMPTVASIP